MDLRIAVMAVALGLAAGSTLQSPYMHELLEDQLAVESGPTGNRVRMALPPPGIDRTPSARVPIARDAADYDSVAVDAGFGREADPAESPAEEEEEEESITTDNAGLLAPAVDAAPLSAPLPWWQLSGGPVIVLQPILIPVSVPAAGRSGLPEYYGAAASPEALGQLGVQALRRKLPFNVRTLNDILRGIYF